MRSAREFSGWQLPLAALFISALTACGGEFDADDMGQDSSAIINGIVDTEFDAVGIVAAGNQRCTGTLVGRRWVLTAAHCVVDMTSASQVSFVTSDQTVYEVSDFEVHPAFLSSSVSDLAVLQLAESPSFEPLPVSRTAPDWFSTVTLVGFGRTSEDDERTGTRMRGEARVHIKTAARIGYLTNWFGSATFCLGDSGGPSFGYVAGIRAIVGIHSIVRFGCSTSAWDARLDTELSWLTSATNSEIYFAGDSIPEPADSSGRTGTPPGETSTDLNFNNNGNAFASDTAPQVPGAAGAGQDSALVGADEDIVPSVGSEEGGCQSTNTSPRGYAIGIVLLLLLWRQRGLRPSYFSAL